MFEVMYSNKKEYDFDREFKVYEIKKHSDGIYFLVYDALIGLWIYIDSRYCTPID